MAEPSDLVHRLRDEPGFVAALLADPATALDGLDLSADDLERLADQLPAPGDVPDAVHRFADGP